MYEQAAGYAVKTNHIRAAQPTGTSPSHTADAIGAIGSARERIYKLAAQARSIADDYFGSMPETADGVSGIAPPASGRMSQLREELSALDHAIAALSTQLDRLTCI